MRKNPVLVSLALLAGTITATGQLVPDSANFVFNTTYGYFPLPFSAGNTQPFSGSNILPLRLPVLTGTLRENPFPETVFLNPGANASLWSGNGRSAWPRDKLVHAGFIRMYDTVAAWDMEVDGNDKLEVLVYTQAPASFNWSRYMQPFWMKKGEVTNAEYREFTVFVRDSLLRLALSKKDTRYHDPAYPLPVDIKVVDSLAPQLLLTPDNRIFGRREYDNTRLMYRYTDASGATQELAIYPDTLVWITQGTYSYGEPMTKRYFGHPAFARYPVTGVSWQQAKAYCHWRTSRLQAYNESLPSGYRLQVDLPFVYERDYATAGFAETGGDYWWLTDLRIPGENQRIKEVDGLLQHKKPLVPYEVDFSSPYGSFYTHPADVSDLLKRKKKLTEEDKALAGSINKQGLSGLDDNVSEWMNESFAENWQVAFEQRRRLINSVQLGRLQKLEPVTLGDFCLRNITALRPQHLQPRNGVHIPGRPCNFNDTIFFQLPFSAVDSIAYFNLWDLAYSRRTLSPPITKPAATSSMRSDDAFERTSISSTYNYWLTEHNLLLAINAYRSEIPILRSIEDYYYSRNQPNGRLVCGGSWYDKRPATGEKNSNGYTTDAKIFLNPGLQSTAVGFRYVIRLVPVSTP